MPGKNKRAYSSCCDRPTTTNICILDTNRYTANSFERDGNYFLWGYPHLQDLLDEVLEAMRDVEISRQDPTLGSDSKSGNEYPLAPDPDVDRDTQSAITSIIGNGRQDMSSHSPQEHKGREISVVKPEAMV